MVFTKDRKIFIPGEKLGCFEIIKQFEKFYPNSSLRTYMVRVKCLLCEDVSDKYISYLLKRNNEKCSRQCDLRTRSTIVPESQWTVEIGEKFGKLEVIEPPFYKFNSQQDRIQYCKAKCCCDKGTIIDAYCNGLKNGALSSCGCQAAETRRKGTQAKNGIKKCSKCAKILSISMFSKCKYQKDGFTSACKDCNRVTKLMSNYGISVADYDSMLLLQNGKCKICGIDKNEEKNKRLMVDHCHETGKVRGLLCIKCNFLLGSAKEDINILLNTIDYLEEYQIL